MNVIISQLKELLRQINELMRRMHIAAKKEQMLALEAQSTAPEFWNSPEQAQNVMQDIGRLKTEVEYWEKLRTRLQDALELAEIEDASLETELNSELKALNVLVEKASLQAMFTGPYDNNDAIFTIHAGAGGTEAQDWAQMLERMYLRWAEQNGYKVEILEESDGEEAGIKSMMMSIRGSFAFGYLQSEQGVHRLVRLSPFDAANRRHTSFAKVELWPDMQGKIDIEINEKDLRVDTYRSSGAGGQNVQKNDTAVRLTHIPTGLVVQCQTQRSQVQNRERAMQILKARLFEMERKKKEAELAVLKGETVDANFGNQIRSYVLHPYQMVKDHRTDFETSNTSAVLDGRLNDFMEAYLRLKMQQTQMVNGSAK